MVLLSAEPSGFENNSPLSTDSSIDSDEEGRSPDPSSLEEWVLCKLQDIVHESAAVATEGLLQRRGPDAQRLQQHIKTMFASNTVSGTIMRKGDWMLYCRIAYRGSIPDMKDVVWPPADQKDWEADPAIMPMHCYRQGRDALKEILPVFEAA